MEYEEINPRNVIHEHDSGRQLWRSPKGYNSEKEPTDDMGRIDGARFRYWVEV